MGMAASQARLLSITSRLADNELRSQIINNSKMRLASESSKISEDYIAALNNATMMITNYDENGTSQCTPLTYNSLTQYSPQNTQYGLIDNNGNILVSEEEADIFRRSAGNLNTFLQEHGLEYTTNFFDAENFDLDENGYIKPLEYDDDNNPVERAYQNYTLEELEEMYFNYDNAYYSTINQNYMLDAEEHENALNTYYKQFSNVYSKVVESLDTAYNVSSDALKRVEDDYDMSYVIYDFSTQIGTSRGISNGNICFQNLVTSDDCTRITDGMKEILKEYLDEQGYRYSDDFSNIYTDQTKMVYDSNDGTIKREVDNENEEQFKVEFDNGTTNLEVWQERDDAIEAKISNVGLGPTYQQLSGASDYTNVQGALGLFYQTKDEDGNIVNNNAFKTTYSNIGAQYGQVGSDGNCYDGFDFTTTWDMYYELDDKTKYDKSEDCYYSEEEVSNMVSNEKYLIVGKTSNDENILANVLQTRSTGNGTSAEGNTIAFAATLKYGKDLKIQYYKSSDTLTSANLDTDYRYNNGDTFDFYYNSLGLDITTDDKGNVLSGDGKTRALMSHIYNKDGELIMDSDASKEQLQTMTNIIYNYLKSELYDSIDKFNATKVASWIETENSGLSDRETKILSSLYSVIGGTYNGSDYIGTVNDVENDIFIDGYNLTTGTYSYIDNNNQLQEKQNISEFLMENIDNLSDSVWVYEHLSQEAITAAGGSDGASILKDEYSNIRDLYVTDQLLEDFGDPYVSWVDVNDKDADGNAKAQWYTNLFNKMSEGYKVLEDGLASSKEWLQYALESGVVVISQVNTTYDWVSTQYSNIADITEVTDDVAVAKAEAEYKKAMNEVEAKDKRYDIELKNIDTEHSALQTEYDSIKSVISKNIERSFKIYS